MTTLYDILSWADKRFLNAQIYYGHGTDNPWDEAVAIARYVLHLPVDANSSALSFELTDVQIKHIEQLVEQRIAQRIPAAYLLNEAWFCGSPYYVDERVLIPRSPIAELIQNRFEPWIDPGEVDAILDIGTGSGCIAIACALAFPEARVDAVDVSQEALEVAAINVKKHNVDQQVSLLHGDLFTPVVGKFDIIVSNPPYVDAAAMSALPREYKHEPALALAGGNDGLDYAASIVQQAKQFLHSHGILVLEIGGNANAFERRFPNLSAIWVDLQSGGEGVCVIAAADL